MVQLSMALSRATVGIPEFLRGRPENVLAVMLMARALQLPLATTWQNVYPTDDGADLGKRSRLLHMLLRRAGHRVVYLDVNDDGAAGLLWIHDSKEPIEVTFRFEEAVRMGLTDEHRDRDGFWARQPGNMCRNRLLTRAVDWHCPEVKGGADFSADGGLLVAGLGLEGEPALIGLGPEVERILAAATAAATATGNLVSAQARVDALRALWVEARLLLDVTVDPDGRSLGTVLTGLLDAAKIAAAAEPVPEAAPAPVPKRKTKKAAVPDPVDAITFPCGCPVAAVTGAGGTGAHLPACETVTARLTRAEGPEGDTR